MNIVETLPDVGRGKDTIRKHSSVINAHHLKQVQFTGDDISFFNYLLLRVRNISYPNGIYQIPIRDVMEFLRFDRPSKVHDCLDRLCREAIEIDYIDENGEERSLRAHYLSHNSSRAETGYIHFAFDPILVHFLQDPKVFGLINVNRSADLKTLAAKRLYEGAALQFGKRIPEWTITVDGFRQLVDMVDKHPRFDNFRRNVIEKAIAEINAIAEFDILLDVMTGGPGGAAALLKFSVVTKNHSRLLQTKAVKSGTARRMRAADPNTVDMYDGLTDKERGGPAELTSEAIERTAKLLPPGEDIEAYVAEWREANRGFSFIDPEQSFHGWVEAQLIRKQDPILSKMSSSIFDALMNDEDD